MKSNLLLEFNSEDLDFLPLSLWIAKTTFVLREFNLQPESYHIVGNIPELYWGPEESAPADKLTGRSFIVKENHRFVFVNKDIYDNVILRTVRDEQEIISVLVPLFLVDKYFRSPLASEVPDMSVTENKRWDKKRVRRLVKDIELMEWNMYWNTPNVAFYVWILKEDADNVKGGLTDKHLKLPRGTVLVVRDVNKNGLMLLRENGQVNVPLSWDQVNQYLDYANSSDLQVGDVVFHNVYGKGIVTAVGVDGNANLVAVEFENPVQKLLGFIHLDKDSLKLISREVYDKIENVRQHVNSLGCLYESTGDNASYMVSIYEKSTQNKLSEFDHSFNDIDVANVYFEELIKNLDDDLYVVLWKTNDNPPVVIRDSRKEKQVNNELLRVGDVVKVSNLGLEIGLKIPGVGVVVEKQNNRCCVRVGNQNILILEDFLEKVDNTRSNELLENKSFSRGGSMATLVTESKWLNDFVKFLDTKWQSSEEMEIVNMLNEYRELMKHEVPTKDYLVRWYSINKDTILFNRPYYSDKFWNDFSDLLKRAGVTDITEAKRIRLFKEADDQDSLEASMKLLRTQADKLSDDELRDVLDQLKRKYGDKKVTDAVKKFLFNESRVDRLLVRRNSNPMLNRGMMVRVKKLMDEAYRYYYLMGKKPVLGDIVSYIVEENVDDLKEKEVRCMVDLLETNDLYAYARDLIDIEISHFEHDPVKYIKSLGWDVTEYPGIEDITLDFTVDDVEELQFVLEKYSIEDLDYALPDEVVNWLTDFIARKIIQEFDKKKRSE